MARDLGEMMTPADLHAKVIRRSAERNRERALRVSSTFKCERRVSSLLAMFRTRYNLRLKFSKPVYDPMVESTCARMLPGTECRG